MCAYTCTHKTGKISLNYNFKESFQILLYKTGQNWKQTGKQFDKQSQEYPLLASYNDTLIWLFQYKARNSAADKKHVGFNGSLPFIGN